MEFSTRPSGWLAFELSILHRLKFASVAIPLTGDPSIGTYLKRRDIRVATNDILQADWHKALAVIQNPGETLSDQDVDLVLDEAYVPGYQLANSALMERFREIDCWWFDNVWRNVDKLDSPFKKAIAISLVIAVGDYVHSFSDETRELRQPLSSVFRRLWTLLPEPVKGGGGHACHNKTPDAFLAECPADTLFLRLPDPEIGENSSRPWREEWVRGGSDFWSEFDSQMAGKLGRPLETRSQYVRQLDGLFDRASNFSTWAVSFVESAALSAADVSEIVGKHRAVEAIYTKDFSELTGKKAVMITA